MNESTKKPPKPWRYVDWIGGQEAFDKMFADCPEQLKLEAERNIMCADMIDGVIQCFWDPPEKFPAWVKKHYPHLTCE